MPNRYLLRLISVIALGTLWVQMAGNAFSSEKSPTAFIHASLIPMTTETLLPDQTVVVETDNSHRSFQPDGDATKHKSG